MSVLEKISPSYDMNDLVLEEKFNISNANILLQSDILEDKDKAGLQKYIKNSQNGMVKVKYTQNGLGRLKTEVVDCKEGETSMRQQIMCNKIKGPVCEKYYNDVDIVNCHPSIVIDLFQQQGLNSIATNKVCNNRDRMLKEINEKCNNKITKDDLKILPLSMINGGKALTWCREHKIDYEDLPDDYYEFEKELRTNIPIILANASCIKYHHKAIEEKGSNYNNLQGSAFSYLIQDIECKALRIMYNTFTENGVTVGALIHDGLHIDKSTYEEDDLNELFNEITKRFKRDLGLHMKLSIKKWKIPEGLNNVITVDNDKEGADIVKDKLKNIYISCYGREFIRINNVWTEEPKTITNEIIKQIGNMNINLKNFNAAGDEKLVCISKTAKGCKDIKHFLEPTEDEDFVDKLWNSNIGLMCFKNGVWDFKNKKLIEYNDDILTTIKINTNYEPSCSEDIKEFYEKVIDPIFNYDREMSAKWLNDVSRGLAGHIEDKNWLVCMGERDCGKGVLVNCLENTFGDYIRSTNSEQFLMKGPQGDSAKALSFLADFEFRRLLITNEIPIDVDGKIKINGNIIKKISSGGDKIEVRQNYKDEKQIKLQCKTIMCCNDLPPIDPNDARETAIHTRFPSKFVNKDNEYLGKKCNGVDMHFLKDNSIKNYIKERRAIKAFMELLFNAYGDIMPIPESMRVEQKEFTHTEKEDDKFYDLFNFAIDDPELSNEDYVEVSEMKRVIKEAGLNVSPQKYGKYLKCKGCEKVKIRNEDDRLVWVWRGLITYD